MKTKVYLLLLILLFALTAFAKQDAVPPDEVSVRLKWLLGAQFAGLYVADQMGFYAEENITVTLNPGGKEHHEIELVSSGQDDFGVVDARLVAMMNWLDLDMSEIEFLEEIYVNGTEE